MYKKVGLILAIFVLFPHFSSDAQNAITAEVKMTKDLSPLIEEQLEIDSVWAANKVSFDLHTIGSRQFVAYYDRNRMMTVASRKLGSNHWEKKTLPSKLMWDSHNYVAMGIDEEGYLHVSGNMHTHPLKYFRSLKPFDLHSLTEIDHMIGGADEQSVTYPKFFKNNAGRLLFSYRSGTCGNGNILLNYYKPEEGQWMRYLKKPLFEGIEENDTRAAYHKFVRDSEGNFHFIWIWRWTPLVETSHQICYAKSTDLIHWENAAGEAIALPFRPDNPKLIVDGTPTNGGMHNSRYQIHLTNDEIPVIGYVKYDEQGLTQLYLARYKSGDWFSKKISDWDFRWKFHGGGDQMSMGGNFSFAGNTPDGLIAIDWQTEKGVSGQYIVDPKSFDHVEEEFKCPPRLPSSIYDRLSDDPELSVNIFEDRGEPPAGDEKYLLKWESMKKSHGKHAPEVIPDGPVSRLILLKIKYQDL